jgi:2-oxoisovalerate dehydrogenase E1 component alpha subunit
MQWTEPSTIPTIPTYRIMNSNSIIEDESQISSEVTAERVLGWYKNMLTGMSCWDSAAYANHAVNIMDGIMFDAQRHGRLSFYMVTFVAHMSLLCLFY